MIPDFDTYYMNLALAVRERANCTGNRVGAVIVRQNRIVSTGYNGVPEGMTNCLEGGCLRCTNPNQQFASGTGYDLCICVHAEQNAILAAARFGIALDGGSIYTTMLPCFNCAKEVLQVGIRRLVYLHPWKPHDADATMQQRKQAEHDRLIARIAQVTRLDLPDPRADWAVRNRREETTRPLP